MAAAREDPPMEEVRTSMLRVGELPELL